MYRSRRPALTLLLSLLGAVSFVVAEPVLLSQDPDVHMDLEGDTDLELIGLAGTISVRIGKDREMRYATRTLDNERNEKPVALWQDGTTLRLTPVAGDEEPLLIEVTVGPELEVRLEVSKATVKLSGLHGATRVSGDELDITVRNLDGSLDLDVLGGRIDVLSVSDETIVEGKDLELRLAQIRGPVGLVLEDCRVELDGLYNGLDADLDRSSLAATVLLGLLKIEASAGSVDLTGIEAGGELRMSETPLSLKQTKGPIEVHTDAEIRFSEHAGSLRIEGFGSAVNGANTTEGLLEIITDNAEVRLAELGGPTKVSGSRLSVEVENSKGELSVNATSSSITIHGAATGLSVQNDFGDIEIHDASNLVKVQSRDGRVKITDLKGPAEVRADGPEVEVSWIDLSVDQASTVENHQGDLRVGLPTGIRFMLDAEAPFGRIESSLPEVLVSEDGHSLAGEMRGGQGSAAYVKKPRVRLYAGGNLYLVGSDPAPADP